MYTHGLPDIYTLTLRPAALRLRMYISGKPLVPIYGITTIYELLVVYRSSYTVLISMEFMISIPPQHLYIITYQ